MKRKKSRQQKSTERYITKLSQDLKKFREREEAGEKISATERKNMSARERRAIAKMKKEASPLIEQANATLQNLEEKGINTLSMQRLYDEFSLQDRVGFSLEKAKSYNDIVQEITLAKAFLNAPDTAALTGSREERNRILKRKYGSLQESLKDSSYVQSGLIPTEEDAKKIFANYRKIEEYYSSLIGKEGQRGVYGSDKLILYMIDIHLQGLDEYEYGMKALEQFSLERTPEYKEMFEKRNEVTGISGLFTKKGVGYGKLAGLL